MPWVKAHFKIEHRRLFTSPTMNCTTRLIILCLLLGPVLFLGHARNIS